ncbi:MAG TPA: hypothetical protein VG651_21520 [Stellaceae bacterium]|nr:hypothetical protein [Stellaceae bacterium]
MTTFDLPSWSAAEFLDTPFSEELILRAVICRLGPARWQWSILTIGSDRGEVIAIGTETSATAARQTAASEIEKCMHDPRALD